MSRIRNYLEWRRNLERWRPFRSLDRLLFFHYPEFFDLEGAEFVEELNRYLDNSLFLGELVKRRGISIPYLGEKRRETEDSYILSVPLPGMEESDINVSLEGRTLRITAEKSYEKEEEEGARYHLRSREMSYDRVMRFSHDVGEEDIDSVYDKGVLTVTVKKPEPVEAKKIPINVVK